jgi:hypothetical protein
MHLAGDGALLINDSALGYVDGALNLIDSALNLVDGAFPSVDSAPNCVDNNPISFSSTHPVSRADPIPPVEPTPIRRSSRTER